MARSSDAINPFEGFSAKSGNKTGGAHASHSDGGIYQKDVSTYLLKRDIKKLDNDIAEYMSAKIFEALNKDGVRRSAAMDLHTSKRGEVFLSSRFFEEGYSDLADHTGLTKGRSPAKSVGEIITNVAGFNITKPELAKSEYTKYEEMTIGSLLLGDMSIHSGNIGVVNRKHRKELVRIDFGAALRADKESGLISDNINPYRFVKGSNGFNKNYFFRDHPKKRIFTSEFADELTRQSQIDLKDVISRSWDDINTSYKTDSKGSKALETFAGRIGATQDNIKDLFIQKMQNRQKSLRDMAFEIQITIAKNKEQIVKAINQNPQHANRILTDPKSYTQIGDSRKMQTILNNPQL